VWREQVVANQNILLILFPVSIGIKIVPVGPWGPRKIFLSSKTMNSQPQHIQKREIVDLQIITYKYKSKNKTLSHSI